MRTLRIVHNPSLCAGLAHTGCVVSHGIRHALEHMMRAKIE